MLPYSTFPSRGGRGGQRSPVEPLFARTGQAAAAAAAAAETPPGPTFSTSSNTRRRRQRPLETRLHSTDSASSTSSSPSSSPSTSSPQSAPSPAASSPLLASGAFSGKLGAEWAGWECRFSGTDGKPVPVPEDYVPETLREWDVEVCDGTAVLPICLFRGVPRFAQPTPLSMYPQRFRGLSDLCCFLLRSSVLASKGGTSHEFCLPPSRYMHQLH